MADSSPMREYLVDLAELARAPRPRAAVGGKALHLARLFAAGLPVPRAWVVMSGARRLEAAAQRELFARLGALSQDLGPRLAVRSSAALEDDMAAAAPGVFASVLHVQPDELEAAVHRVWASARTELVREYARLRGVHDLEVAVIVQTQVPPDPARAWFAGTLYTRVPGHPESRDMLLDIRSSDDREPGQASGGGRTPRGLRLSRDTPLPQESSRDAAPLEAPVLETLREAALLAERAIATPGGADVEWVAQERDIWLVQARPIATPPRMDDAPERPGLPLVMLAFSELEPELVWRWDAKHNPEPLSLAQTGLIERLDQARVAPYRMRVVGGYLYFGQPEARRAPSDAPHHVVDTRARDAAALCAHFEHQLVPAMLAALPALPALPAIDAHPTPAPEPPDLARALAAYHDFYAVYAGRLGPLLSHARAALPRFLVEHLGPDTARHTIDALAFELIAPHQPTGVDALVRAAAAGHISRARLEAELGSMAAAWDVASPTLAEMPELLSHALADAARRAPELDAAAARARSRSQELAASLGARLPSAARPDFERVLALSRAAFELSERDDLYFAQAQAMLRRALLCVAARWAMEPADQIFYLPLDTVLAWADHAHGPDLLAAGRMARAGQAAIKRARAWNPPHAFARGAPLPGPEPHDTPGPDDHWSGRGIGGRASGVCVRVARLDDAPSHARGAVVVTQTVTPAMAVWLRDAAALVAEYGGLLDHGAAMARELGIPCVVGCQGIWSDVRSGDRLHVDGDAGQVTRSHAPDA